MRKYNNYYPTWNFGNELNSKLPNQILNTVPRNVPEEFRPGNDLNNRNSLNNYNDLNDRNCLNNRNGLNNNNERNERDMNDEMNYMKNMYPDFCKKILAFVDESCDKLEYEGSYMFDEYPDREAIEALTDQILDRINQDETVFKKDIFDEEIEATIKRNPWQRDFVKVILLNEMFGRRRRWDSNCGSSKYPNWYCNQKRVYYPDNYFQDYRTNLIPYDYNYYFY